VAKKQEQEPARSEVVEVAPGVLRMELPIRLPGLGHVNCYAILDGEGAAIVDPGLPGPGSWRALQDRLKTAGLATRNVHTVIVTHSHPDHFGGAARFARESGADVIAHRTFSFGPPSPHDSSEVSAEHLGGDEPAAPEGDADPVAEQRTREAIASHTTPRTPWGGQRPRPPLLTRLKWHAMRWVSGRIIPVVTRPVEHGDVLELGGREWFVVHTPGHTGDHFCLHDPTHATFLAGDHVLPSITPHISGLASSEDPLASYFYSLDRVAELSDVKQVLPAHGHPFTDLKARTEAIKLHHFERLEKLKEISGELGPATVQAFSQRLFKPRSWGAMAESETFAHLEHLRIAGNAELRIEPDGQYLYQLG
jgi:glyoxylase-like metal-dependent hydrolase (beta-lactamase superfamily II)